VKGKTDDNYPVPLAMFLAGCLLLLAVGTAGAETISLPNISLSIGGGPPESPTKTATVIQLLFILTVLSLAPAILLMVTSFTRVVVVLSLLRHALGTQQIPPNQIVIGMALFLTFFIMTPVWQKVNQEALRPYYNEEISGEEAMNRASGPIKSFMLKQTR